MTETLEANLAEWVMIGVMSAKRLNVAVVDVIAGFVKGTRTLLPASICQRWPLKIKRRQKRTHGLSASYSNNQITKSALTANGTVRLDPLRIIPHSHELPDPRWASWNL